MRALRRFLRPLLALALLAASAPSWACVRACDGKAVSLACVRLCEQSQALLSQNGQLATLGHSACGVQASDHDLATLSVAPQLSQPQAVFAVAVSAPVLSLPQRQFAAAELRGPPSFASVLLASTPHANAPPFSV